MPRTRCKTEETCGECLHFLRHYVQLKDASFLPTQFGHCIHPRVKERQADEHYPCWTPAPEDTKKSPDA